MVAKVVAPAIAHKTEAGGVKVGLEGPAEVRLAWREILAGAERYQPGVRVDGVLVQRQVRGTAELIVGMSRDPAFGPLVMFGLGGVFVEVLRDVMFRVAPISGPEARDLLDGIRGRRILDGVRGAPPADREALQEVLVRVAQLAADYPEITEVDINPMLALPDGCIAADARVALSPA